MSDGTAYIKLLVLIYAGVLFIFLSSLVAKHLGCKIKHNTTLLAVKLANGTKVYNSGISNGLISSV